MRRVDGQYGDGILVVLVLLHAFGADFLPEILGPVQARGVAEDVDIGSRPDDGVWVLGVENHPTSLPAPDAYAGHQAAVVLRAAAENLAVGRRDVDVVEHGVDQSPRAHRPGFAKILTGRDAAIVSGINQVTAGQEDGVLVGVHVLGAILFGIPVAGARPGGAAVAADVDIEEPADHRIGIVRMHRDGVVVAALAFGGQAGVGARLRPLAEIGR